MVEDVARLMAGSHVGHNARLGAGAVLVNGAVLAGHSEVGPGAILSAYAGIHQFARVGRLTMLTSSSGASYDVPPFSIASGSHPTCWRGPNAVGLRRAGFSEEERDALRQALHRAFAGDEGAPRVAEELLQSPYAPVVELAEFILSSKRGLISGPR